MAEIGLVASIIAVIQLTGQVAGLSLNYIGSIKGASKNIRELASELGSLSQVLSLVLDYAEANSGQPTALELLSAKDGPLQKCAEELKRVRSKLDLKSKGRVINSLKWPLKEDETMRCISWIERKKSLFSFALTADNISLSKAIHDGVQGIEKSLESTHHTIQVGFAAQSSRQQQDDLRLAEEERKRALDWLYSGDFNLRHNEIKSIRQEGTGQWLPKRSEFGGWSKQQQACRLLWGHGIPGAGKTFLSSIIVDYFRSQAQAAGYGVAHIYFNYQEQESQEPIQVFSSLVRQLANQVPALPESICKLYHELERKGERPTLETLFTTLLEVSRSFAHVFLIFDGLDECHPETRRRDFLPLFNRMGKSGIHVFVTSRPHPQDIQDAFCDAIKIELFAHDEDIASYIQEKVEGSSRANALVLKAKCMDRVISGLTECAKGMFLLVRFHIEYLCQQTTARNILRALEKLKGSSTIEGALNEAYERAVDTIRRQDESSRDLAFKVLSWLVSAKRTLKVEELRIAVSVEPERFELDELDLPDSTTLIDVCASLVAIDEGTIRLSHYTVQEYLQKSSLIPTDAKFNLAMVCITYLSFDTLAQGACSTRHSMLERLKVHPFAIYAAYYLPDHLKECDETLSVDMYLRFIENKGSISSWNQLVSFMWWVVFAYNNLDLHRHLRMASNPLNIASSHGHLTAVRLLLDNAADITARDYDESTALHWAAMAGHEVVVKLLLDTRADITAQDCNGYTALHRAAMSGREAVVRLLLDNGADLTTRSKHDSTAFLLAAQYGRDTVVELLFDKGADLWSYDKDGDTALHCAVFGRRKSTINLLLDKGADPSVLSNSGRTPLDIASEENYQDIVDLLVKRKCPSAQVNMNHDPPTAALCICKRDDS